jgi:Myb-like DNA-binding domain
LKALIDEHGTCSWTKVGESFSERTGKQCRERWYNHLDPSVKKGEWTAEVRKNAHFQTKNLHLTNMLIPHQEDMILSTMQKTIGNQWAKVNHFTHSATKKQSLLTLTQHNELVDHKGTSWPHGQRHQEQIPCDLPRTI